MAAKTSQVENLATPIDQIPALLDSITLQFLKDRAAGYAASGLRLAQALRQLKESQQGAHGVLPQKSIAQYGKSARLLDMIMAVGGSAGYLAPADRDAVDKIRRAIQADLSPYVFPARDGLMVVNTPQGQMRTGTQSAFGRRMAGLFARVVPPTEQDRGQNAAYLSDETTNKINGKLTTAASYLASGDAKHAADLYQEVLQLNRKNFTALKGLGGTLAMMGQHAAARTYLQEARLINPNDAAVLVVLGECLTLAEEFAKAEEAYAAALKIAPHHQDVLAGIALLHFRRGDDAAADRAFADLFKKHPDSPAALIQHAQILFMRADVQRAALQYLKAIQLNPRMALGHMYLAILRSYQGKSADARAEFARAEQLEPHNETVQAAKAYFLLAEGDYLDAWKLYEGAAALPEWRRVHLVPGKPVWKGEDISGKKLLIIQEQGLGDTLQFIRYAAMCKARAARVYVQCSKQLQGLLENCPFIDEVFTSAVPARKYDVQVSMLSLPFVFGTALDTVPATVPYLFVPDNLKAKWAAALPPRDGRPRVGLVWSGSLFQNTNRGDLRAKQRNIALKQLQAITDRTDIQLVNLQMGDDAAQIDALGLRDRFANPMSNVNDLLDTAAIIENLDLVISVDTSVVHLAGALGKPVWVLSRYDACWRWLRNRSDSPWYPTARVFGQKTPGDWVPVVQNVAAALDEFKPQ